MIRRHENVELFEKLFIKIVNVSRFYELVKVLGCRSDRSIDVDTPLSFFSIFSLLIIAEGTRMWLILICETGVHGKSSQYQKLKNMGVCLFIPSFPKQEN